MTDRFVEPEIDRSDWPSYFKSLRELGLIKHEYKPAANQGDEPSEDSGDSDFSHVTVVEPAHEIESGWPQGLGTWRKRCLEAGWQVKMGHSLAHHEDVYHKNGNLKKAAHDEEQWWLNAVKDGSYITISYNVIDGKATPNRTVRQVRGGGGNLTDAQMKEVVTA